MRIWAMTMICLALLMGCVSEQAALNESADAQQAIADETVPETEQQETGAEQDTNETEQVDASWKQYNNYGIIFDYPEYMEKVQEYMAKTENTTLSLARFVSENETVLAFASVDYSSALKEIIPTCNHPVAAGEAVLLLSTEDDDGDPLFDGLMNNSINKSDIDGSILPSSMEQYPSRPLMTYAHISFTLDDQDDEGNFATGHALEFFNCETYVAVSVRITGYDAEEVDSLKEQMVQTFEFG